MDLGSGAQTFPRHQDMLVRCQALSLCSPSLLEAPHTLWSWEPLEPPKHPSTLPDTLQLRGVPNSHVPWLRLCGPPGAPAGSFTLSLACSLALSLSSLAVGGCKALRPELDQTRLTSSRQVPAAGAEGGEA